MIITSPNAWKAWKNAFPQKANEQTPAYKTPFRIVNKTPAAAEILIYDQIGRDFWSGEGMAANDFAEILNDIDPMAELTIGINSPGGNVWDGLAIHNMLVARKARVVTRNDGMAASIASIILQAGHERQSNTAAMVMIHRAWGLMIGNADDATKFKAELEKHDQVLAELLSSRSGRPLTEIQDAMSAETFFTGTEAKEFGLVDTLLSSIAKDAAKNNLMANAIKPGVINNAAGTKPPTQIIMNTPAPAPAAPTPPATPTPAAAPPIIDMTAVIEAINALPDRINRQPGPPALGTDPVHHRIENLGNPIIERFNSLSIDRVQQAQFARTHYADLRKQKMIAAGVNNLPVDYDRFDFRDPQIRNANTVDAALANTIMTGDFITTMRTYIAPWSAFTRKVEFSPVSKRQTIEVNLVSSAGSKQQNATNYETGDSVMAAVPVVAAEESKSFHVTRPQTNLGLQLASLVPTNAKVLAEGIHAKMTALMIAANYGAATVIGAAANFDSSDLAPILALGKNYDQVRLLLDGGHLAYLLPTSRDSFTFGEPGAYGFDGGIWKNNLWTSGIANLAGLVCGPDAIVNGWAPAEGLPTGEFLSQSTADVNGIPFGMSVWFSRASREVWGSFQIMHGCAVGDPTQAELLVTA